MLIIIQHSKGSFITYLYFYINKCSVYTETKDDLFLKGNIDTIVNFISSCQLMTFLRRPVACDGWNYHSN